MCGKFTAQASWREVVSFSQPLAQGVGGGASGDEAIADDAIADDAIADDAIGKDAIGKDAIGKDAGGKDASGKDAGGSDWGAEDDGGNDGGNDGIVTYRVGAAVPVIVWDAAARARRVVPMRWGFPDPRDWRRPRPIHARSETVDIKEPFRAPFHAGQRGIVVFRTFNEGEEIFKPTGRPETRQWTIDPQDGRRRGFAFVWRRYAIEGQPAPLLFCVMATAPANELIRRTVKGGEDDPRMPAILDDDAWAAWLGEDGADPASSKALLKTMEGVNWTSAPEPRKPRSAGPRQG